GVGSRVSSPPDMGGNMKITYAISVAAASALVLGACSSGSDAPASSAAAASPGADAGPVAGGSVTVLVYDSFALPDEVIADFTATTGVDVTFEPVGDAGVLTNQIALTAGVPLGDAVYGIDNTFASRAIASGALADY